MAHNMPTSYVEFINDYYKNFAINAAKTRNSYANEDLSVRIENGGLPLSDIFEEKESEICSLSALKESVRLFNKRSHRYVDFKPEAKIDIFNFFLEFISEQSRLNKWVDIEEEYYKQLTGRLHDYNRIKYKYLELDAETINSNLTSIEKSLEDYLTTTEKKYLPCSANPQILDKIYSKFRLKDFSSRYKNAYHVEVKNRLVQPTNMDEEISLYGKVYKIPLSASRIEKFKEKHMSTNLDESILKKDIQEGDIPDFYLVPNNILFLTFNYTHAEVPYAIESPIVSTIHIHGEINTPGNPMIFGYGDELGSEYHQLENLKDDEVLKNMKSVRYLETDNYKRLLDFIESEPYQIFIMGHSCGTSDRTLLNTLFEHKHCASIKPFFHQMSEKEDNYSNIVRGISRNFKDKPSMRDKVVNRTFCEPLVAIKN